MVSIRISNESKTPIYGQISHQFKEFIKTGELKRGDILPGRQALAKELGLNINTINHAYRILENEGYIYSRRGIGSFVNPKAELKTKGELVDEIRNEIRLLARRASAQGWGAEEFKGCVHSILSLEKETVKPRGLFVECHQAWTDDPARMLQSELGIEVKPLVMSDDKTNLGEVIEALKEADIVITTHVHFNEVRDIAGSGKIIFPLDMHLSYDLLRQLATVRHGKIAVPFLKPATVQRLNHWIRAVGFDIDLVPIRHKGKKNLVAEAQGFKTWMVAPNHKKEIELILPRGVRILTITSVLGEQSIQRLKEKLSEMFQTS